MGSVKSFGIGCFQFGIVKEWADVTFKMYFDSLKVQLESISAISSVELDYSIDSEHKIDLVSTDIQVGNLLPLADFFFKMKLDIHIPFRVQAELLDTIVETNTEDFTIIIDYQYYFPICIVLLNQEGDNARPSDAVVIVKRFFERNFPKDGYIKFESLGPSPFHANLHLVPDINRKYEKNRRGLYCARDLSRAYDTIKLYYDIDVYVSHEEAFSVLFDEIFDEISIYYRLVSIRNSLSDKWSDILLKVDCILEASRAVGFFNTLAKAISLSNKIDNFIVSLSLFEHDLIETNKEIKNMLAGLHNYSGYIYLKHYIEDVQEGLLIFPTKELFRMVSLLEMKRSKKVELISYFTSACIGGMAGSLVTLLAK